MKGRDHEGVGDRPLGEERPLRAGAPAEDGGLRAVPTVVLAIVAVGSVCLLPNLDQPIVRNSLVYARASEHILEHGGNPLPVAADGHLSYGKPIGFAWLSSPLVAALGPNVGLKVASFVATLLFLLAVWHVLRVFDPFELAQRERALCLWLVFLTPIVGYQFWSAHPDTLLAALYLYAFAQTYALASDPYRRTWGRAALLGLTIFASILVKNYGLVLLLSCPLYLLGHLRTLWSSREGRRAVAGLVVVFVLLGLTVVLGLLRYIPLIEPDSEGGGGNLFFDVPFLVTCVGTLLQLATTLFLNLHVALLPVLHKANTANRRFLWALLTFPVIYVAGLTPFRNAYCNMRYFVPVLPFVALAAVHGLRHSRALLRRGLPVLFTAIGMFLVVLYNVAPVYERVADHLLNPRYKNGRLLDNLRIGAHIQQALELRNINEQVAPGGIVYMWNIHYYGDAWHGVYERSGLIRPDIETRYVNREGLHPTERMYYVYSRHREPALAQMLGEVEVTDLGGTLYRVEAAHR